MVDHNTTVTEDELHVYVDGELPADRREAVETWLSGHPDDAVRVAAWRAQAEAIRARYGAVIHEPIPNRLALGKIMRDRRSWSTVAAAAAVVAFVIGGAAGWVARGASAAAPTTVGSPSRLPRLGGKAETADRHRRAQHFGRAAGDRVAETREVRV